jgi:hypothetical protein
MTLSIFRDAAWLTTDRVRVVTGILLGFTVMVVMLRPLLMPGATMGYDSIPLWVASGMAARGTLAYGQDVQSVLLEMAGPGSHWICGYPPTALLVWLPFSLLPFSLAVALFLCVTTILYAITVRILFGLKAVAPALAYPAVFVCLLYGQNSLLSAALFAAAAITLDRRPLTAGLMIGCLAFKPQLAVLAPLALAVSGRWRAFAGAAIGLLGFIFASILVFGVDEWIAYPAVMREVEAYNAVGAGSFTSFISLYSSTRLLGGSENIAWAVQGLGAIVAIVVLVVTAKRRATGWRLISLLITATGFCVPFLGEYDLVIFSIVGLWLVYEGIHKGWLPYERFTLAVLYFSPGLILLFSSSRIPLGPVMLVALAVMVLRRNFHQPVAAIGASESVNVG